MEYHYTKRILERYVGRECSVLEIGCGTGYYGVHLSGRCKAYHGIDISPGNINVFSEKIEQMGLGSVTAAVGDATDMASIGNEQYDIVLTLGPMYHLPPGERDRVFENSKRVCKAGGILLFAYINKLGVYLGSCIRRPDVYPNGQKNQSILREGIDDSRESMYWFTMPEEMEDATMAHGLCVFENLGVDYTLAPSTPDMGEAQKAAWADMIAIMCQSKSCAGFANHAVMVCRK